MKSNFRLLLAAALACLLLGLPGPASAQAPGWTPQTVTAAGLGDCPVVQLDARGNTHLLYFYTPLKSLYYTQFNGSTWSAPMAVDPSRAGHMQCMAGMVLQSTARPAVVYVTDDNRLYYVPMVGSTFRPQEITLPRPGLIHSPNLTLAPGDVPLIVMAHNTNLAYISPTAGGWRFEWPVKNAAGDPVLIGEHSPINILRDSQGSLHFSYYCMKHFTWYLWRGPAGFVLPVRMTLDLVDDTRPSVALALDAFEQPHVSSTVGVNPQLRLYSRACSGGSCTWSAQVIDQLPDTAPTSEISWVRMAYDPYNRLVLAYYYRDASGAAGLRLQTFDGSNWSKKMIDPRADYGRRSSLALNSPERAVVAYAAGGPGGLVYASGPTLPLPAMSYQYVLPMVGR